MSVTGVLLAVVPSIAVCGLFFFVLRLIIRADRREREAIARFDAEQAATRE